MSRLPREVLIRPLITEESSILQAEQNKYTFAVHVGRRPDWKKAIVKLAEGETIDMFKGV